MAKTNTKHFQHYTQNVLNQNTLEELLEEPPRYLNFKEPIEFYSYSQLNKDQRKSFYDFNPNDDSLSLTYRCASDHIGFQEPRGKSSSLFLATQQKVVGYLTLQFQSKCQYGGDIPSSTCYEVGLGLNDKIAVIRCLAVDQDFERHDCGATLFAAGLDSIIHTQSNIDPSIKYVVWDSLESSHSYYVDKLGFAPFQMGKYNFAIALD